MRIFTSRISAYKFFKMGVLISLFLTQFFDFYNNRFTALYGLIFNLALLVTVNTLIEREKTIQEKVAKS